MTVGPRSSPCKRGAQTIAAYTVAQPGARTSHLNRAGAVLELSKSARESEPQSSRWLSPAWGQRRELNPQPLLYESSALPLSYSGDVPTRTRALGLSETRGASPVEVSASSGRPGSTPKPSNASRSRCRLGSRRRVRDDRGSWQRPCGSWRSRRFWPSPGSQPWCPLRRNRCG